MESIRSRTRWLVAAMAAIAIALGLAISAAPRNAEAEEIDNADAQAAIEAIADQGGGIKDLVSSGGSSPAFMALLNDGTLWNWGLFTWTFYPDDIDTQSYIPRKIGENFDEISSYGAAIDKDHTLWTWDYITNSGPTKMLENVKASCGYPGFYYFITRNDELLKCEDDNEPSRITDNVDSVYFSPSGMLVMKKDATLWTISDENAPTLTKLLDDVAYVLEDFPFAESEESKVFHEYAIEAAITNSGELKIWGSMNSVTGATDEAPRTLIDNVARAEYSGGSYTGLAALTNDGQLWEFGKRLPAVGAWNDPTIPYSVLVSDEVTDCQINGYGTPSIYLKNGSLWSYELPEYGAITNVESKPLSAAATFKSVHDGFIDSNDAVWDFDLNADGELASDKLIKKVDNVDRVTPLGVITKDGGLWTYGFNMQYILGNDQATESLAWYLTPTEILQDVKTVYGGSQYFYAAAIKDDGSLWMWGTGASDTVTSHAPFEVAFGATETIYRLYNEASGEHLFTKSANEYNVLPSRGWTQEGEAWKAPVISDTPVYRLSNPTSGDHHYTTQLNEYNNLPKVGWQQEGIAFYSAAEDQTPVYRLFNEGALVGTHHYTTDRNEYNNLPKVGWKQEDIGWYGISDQ